MLNTTNLKTMLLALIVTGGAILATARIIDAVARHRSASAMTTGAQKFLGALAPEQRAQAVFDFGDEQRYDAHLIPRPRKGLPFKEMDEKQRQLALDFLKTGLSTRGFTKARTIMTDLELILREMEKNPVRRDPELYYFSIFGTPSTKDRWGWRVEGHHLSLNYTVVNGEFVATTPILMGTNPAEVREGPRKGLRVLGAEEDLGRTLLRALDEKQRAEAIFDQKAFPDILTLAKRKVDPLEPVGVRVSNFNASQKKLLNDLLNEYAATMPADIAAERMEKLRRAGMDNIRFGWAGGTERGDPHYYRLQGPTFLVEYDNTQNNANHIHITWRDFNGDWGEDLLRGHYKNAPHHQGKSRAE